MDLQAAFAWYSDLARRAGWADYTIDRARELAKDFHSVFGALPDMLLKAHPKLARCTLGRSQETRANTYRLRPERFHAPQVVTRKRKERT